MPEERAADVYFNQALAGRLTETPSGFEFRYNDDYLAGGTPISFALPLQQGVFQWSALPGFFDNLVAEGWLRKLQSREQKIDESDHFGLLLANGMDLAGAVTVVPAGKGNND